MTVEDKIHVFKNIYFYVPQNTAEKPIETLYENLPKTQQYWRRETDFPKFFYDYNPHLPPKQLCRLDSTVTHYIGDRLVSLSVQDTQTLRRLVEREIRRMQNGIFIMNNGIKIYFPGPYYGMLQWTKMIGVKTNEGYGEHRRYQREFACQRQKVIEDPKLRAYYLHKIKKCGITQVIACFYAIESNTRKQQAKVFMSKNHDTAKSANFKYYGYALKTYPGALLASIETKGWRSAVQKIQIRSNDPELSLENVVVAVPTTEDGTDGLPPITNICYSEIAKYDDAEIILSKSQEQLQLQQTKIGIAEMECYPPENDGKSFRFCKKMYNEDCNVLDEDGYPKNKTVPLYIGLLESTNDTFDIYGEPNKKKALDLELAERAKCDTPAKIQARQRQYHMTAKEGWESGGGGSVYNNLILTAREVELTDEYDFGQLNYIEANLEWTGVRFNSPVRCVPLTLQDKMNKKVAKWKMYKSLQYLEKNTNLCFKMPKRKKFINGEWFELLQPPDDIIHCAGTDPVDYALVSELNGRQSTNASVVRDISGDLVSVYYYRDEDPDVSIEDFAMEMIYFGTYSIVEGNRKNAVTSLEKIGMYYFILIRHPNGEIKPYLQSVAVKHVSSGKDLKSLYIGFVSKHIKNNIEWFKSVPIIQDHKEFEPDATQFYDYSVADGLSFVAVDAMQTWVMSKKNKLDQYEYLGYAIKMTM